MKGEKKPLTAKFYGTEKGKMTIGSKEELDGIINEIQDKEYKVARCV